MEKKRKKTCNTKRKSCERTNGTSYIGEFLDNKPHGQGTYIGIDGSTYVGNWEMGEQHGEGTLTDKTGKVTYSGKWDMGKPKNFFN